MGELMSTQDDRNAEQQKAVKAQQHGMQGVAKALAKQRDAAQSREVELAAQVEIVTAALVEAQETIKALQAEVDKLKPKEPPVDAAKAAAEAASRGQPKIVKTNGKGESKMGPAGSALPGLP